MDYWSRRKLTGNLPGLFVHAVNFRPRESDFEWVPFDGGGRIGLRIGRKMSPVKDREMIYDVDDMATPQWTSAFSTRTVNLCEIHPVPMRVRRTRYGATICSDAVFGRRGACVSSIQRQGGLFHACRQTVLRKNEAN